MSKPAILSDPRYKLIKKQAAKETRAIKNVVTRLGKTFDIKSIKYGFDGGQFAENEITFTVVLKHKE